MTSKHKVNPALAAIVTDMQKYITKYVAFSDSQYALPLALWSIATYMWESFDAMAYLVITSDTKRSGKTRLAECLSFASCNSRNIAGMTPATIFRAIRDDKPTFFMDEAESLSSESATVMRSVLNVGYRKGQTIPRMGKAGIEDWPVYCPKVFILIGDVYDTLRDRSINIRMKRSNVTERFLHEIAKGEGAALGARMQEAIKDVGGAVAEQYMSINSLGFLQDREEEIWLSLFSIAAVFCPDRMDELTRAAVDMSTEKTGEARIHSELSMKEAEREAADSEYAERLLLDMLVVAGTKKHVFSADMLPALHDLSTGPWRKFRGAGLTAMDMSFLLKRFDVAPKVIRDRKAGKLLRGYLTADIKKAVESNSLKRH